MRQVLFILLFTAPAAAAPPIVIDAPAPGSDSLAVATPLELQLRGTPGVRHIRSLSADGRCLVRLDLDPNADRGRVRADVANRIALAEPQLPEATRRRGVRLRPDADDAVVAVAVRSDGRADIAALTAAADRARPRLVTVPQVADVVSVGAAEVGPRVSVDADKLAAFNLTAADVLTALRPAVTADRPAPTPNDLGNVVVKTIAGQQVLLRDVAVVRSEVHRTSTAGAARPGGEPTPVVLLLVRPAPGAVAAVNAAVGRLLDGPDWDLPPGVTLERLPFGTGDTAATLRLPAGTRPDQRDQLARDAATAAVRSANVRSVAWVAGPGDHVTLLVAGFGVDLGAAKLAPPGVAVRVGRMRWPLDDWPGEGAAIVARVSGETWDAVGAAADRLRERMAMVPGVTDPAAEPGERVRATYQIDRAKAAKLGVTLTAVNETIELATSGVRVGSVVVRLPPPPADDLRALRIPNGEGQLVPLGTVVEARQEHGPAAVYREDGRPCRVVACGVGGRDAAAVRADVRGIARQLATAGITIVAE
jgi:multidrug efflux pump subunit AcrB